MLLVFLVYLIKKKIERLRNRKGFHIC